MMAVRETVRGSERVDSTPLFAMFVAGFILIYGCAAIGLEAGLGIVGFAKAPYLNAVSYLYALAFVLGGLLRNKVTFRFFVPHPLAIGLLIATAISALIGIGNNNPYQYIVGWSFYIVVGVVVFQFFRNARNGLQDKGRILPFLFSPPVAGLILVFAFLSIFNKENNYQYVLFEVIALYAILIRQRLVEKAFGLFLYVMLHLGSNDGFVQVEINRASILALGTVGLVFMIYRRYFVTLAFLVVVALGAVTYALTLDRDTVETLPRNIKEAILLMQGDDIANHTSSFQRVFEAQKVMKDYEGASDWEWAFGMGLGRTVDMTDAGDKTPGQHALLGATQVHNIHFLNYAVFHKFGLVGVTILFALISSVVGMLVVDLAQGRADDNELFFYFYVLYNLVFAAPASNFLIANPLWSAFFGYLCLLRAGRVTLGARERAKPA